MKYARTHTKRLQKMIRSARLVFLILDFDGTLASIAKTPHSVRLDKKIKDVIVRLSRAKKYKIAIISGRSLENLVPYFHLKNIFYAGNHGLELRGKGLKLPPKALKARKYEALIWLIGEKLRKDLSKVPGILIEDKNYTLSVHYRNVPREYLPFLSQEIDFFKKKYSHWPILWKEGKRVWEVRPKAPWGKGDAALHMLRGFPRALPIVIGDDVTDEDMFKAFRHKGITIRVGRSKTSCARYYLRFPADVGRFLKYLSEREGPFADTA